MEAPDWLGEKAKAKWKELTTKYPSLSEKDHDTLILLCEAWQVFLQAAEDVDRNGTSFHTGTQIKKNPSVDHVNEYIKTIARLNKQLGLTTTPNAKVDKAASVSPLKKLIENR